MNRKRPRPLPSAQQLVAVIVAFATVSPRPSRGFVMPSVASLLSAGRRNMQHDAPSSPTAVAGHLEADPRLRGRLEADKKLRRRVGRRKRPRDGGEFQLDPDDRLPRTMEELYRQVASAPPPQEDQSGEIRPGPKDMEIVEEAVRSTFKCTEDDAWWDRNGVEWDRMAANPSGSFAVGGDDDDGGAWGMEDYFGEEAPGWKPSDEVEFYSLSAYKAGITGSRAAGTAEGRDLTTRDAVELFGRTPFAQYWESLPDLSETGRVYAYNAVDRMAALKFMMNFTCGGMLGSANSLQVITDGVALPSGAATSGLFVVS